MIAANSSAVNAPGLRSFIVGDPDFPMSWSSAPSRMPQILDGQAERAADRHRQDAHRSVAGRVRSRVERRRERLNGARARRLCLGLGRADRRHQRVERVG